MISFDEIKGKAARREYGWAGPLPEKMYFSDMSSAWEHLSRFPAGGEEEFHRVLAEVIPLLAEKYGDRDAVLHMLADDLGDFLWGEAAGSLFDF